MIFDEFPTPLPFYHDKSMQNRYKENYTTDDIFDLWALNDRAIPFQFRYEPGSVFDTFQIFKEDGTLLYALDETVLLFEDVEGFKYVTWFANEPLLRSTGETLDLDCGKFYFKINFDDPENNPALYSEVFSIMEDPDNYFILDWSNSIGDIDPVYYGSGYTNRIYSDTFITKGLPTIEIDSEKDGFGNTVPITKKMLNTYDFSLLLVPNYFLEAINFIALHDYVYLTTKSSVRNGQIENVTVEQEQIDTRALWEVTVKFNQPKFYFSGSCSTPIAPPQDEDLIINTGTPAQTFDLIFDAN